VLQRLFAPVLPFVTDEVWHWWHEHSVHVSPWPVVTELPSVVPGEAGLIYGPLCEVLEAVRREKSTAKVSQRAEVELVELTAPAAFLAAVTAGIDDLKAAGGVRELTMSEGDVVAVTVTLVAS
jgi:valyl-tRNA synthetase